MHISIPENLPSTILPIKAFKDNYIWIISRNDFAVIVDPGESSQVIEFINKNDMKPEAILITHKHFDHINGIKKLLDYYPAIKIYGPAKSNFDFPYKSVKENDIVTMNQSKLRYKVIEIPGHTLDHIAYLDTDLIFCGDTLFGCGCGKLFEGTPEQMFSSLQKIKSLNVATKIYCGHEYTLNNIRFAMTEEVNNLDLSVRYQKIKNKNLTLPTLLSEELATNPFLRAVDSDEFKEIRGRKDAF
jgi:hydroxyacylglutathione hydrolase|tara:strand:- start:6778 stop:7506 length:729 start_codon:yes stop_codon:yes gene_type:complete